MLLAFLQDWVLSLDQSQWIDPVFVYPAQNPSILLTEETYYNHLLSLPAPLRDTLLYLLRFVLNVTIFHRSVNQDDLNSDLIAFIRDLLQSNHVGVPTHPHASHPDSATNSQSIAVLLRTIAIHPREAFLPEDPMIEAIDKMKVLLYSGITPNWHPTNLPYAFTLQNLHHLEQTAFKMFQFGLLPERNTFGFSIHSLPDPLVEKIPLFRPEGTLYAKMVSSRVYVLTHVWIAPFLGQLFVAEENRPCVAIPITSIRVCNDDDNDSDDNSDDEMNE